METTKVAHRTGHHEVIEITLKSAPMDDIVACEVINLSHYDDAVAEVWQTGRLPAWLRQFKALKVLKAPSMGLVVVNDWIAELTELEEVYFENNAISTWPRGLDALPKLSIISFDGNPCLERSFRKSPTLRTAYFSWSSTTSEAKQVPKEIRGPEWAYASQIRPISPLKLAGYYCGGIYTLEQPPLRDTSELITPLDMCPVQKRLVDNEGPQLVVTGGHAEQELVQVHANLEDHSAIIKGIIRDIAVLCRTRSAAAKDAPPPAPVSPIVLRMLNRCDVTWEHIAHIMGDLLSTEELYIRDLRMTILAYCKETLKQSIEKFFRQSVVKILPTPDSVEHMLTISVPAILQDMFKEFPVLWLLHSKCYRDALQELHDACRTPRKGRDFDCRVAGALMRLSRAFTKGKSIYQQYAAQVAHAEEVLGFEDVPGTGSYVERRLGSTELGKKQIELKQWIERGKDNRVKETGKKKVKKGCSLAAPKTNEPANMLMLPLQRLLEYDCFFRSASKRYQCFQSVADIVSDTRTTVLDQLQSQRQQTRASTLAIIYKTELGRFAGYKWDAVVSVESRAYLEIGKLEYRNNDVIDPVTRSARSLVKEIFDHNKRELRLIGTDKRIEIWDDKDGHFIGAVSPCHLEASAEDNQDRVRLHFIKVRETCVVAVKRFTCADPHRSTQQSVKNGFLSAVYYKL